LNAAQRVAVPLAPQAGQLRRLQWCAAAAACKRTCSGGTPGRRATAAPISLV